MLSAEKADGSTQQDTPEDSTRRRLNLQLLSAAEGLELEPPPVATLQRFVASALGVLVF